MGGGCFSDGGTFIFKWAGGGGHVGASVLVGGRPPLWDAPLHPYGIVVNLIKFSRFLFQEIFSSQEGETLVTLV